MTTDKAEHFAYLLCVCGADIPTPVREYQFAKPRRWRADFAWIPQRVMVEIDGGRWMPGGGRHGGDADKEKVNTAGAMGWIVLHFSPTMLRDDPGMCLDFVRRALRVRLR